MECIPGLKPILIVAALHLNTEVSPYIEMSTKIHQAVLILKIGQLEFWKAVADEQIRGWEQIESWEPACKGTMATHADDLPFYLSPFGSNSTGQTRTEVCDWENGQVRYSSMAEFREDKRWPTDLIRSQELV